MSLVDGRERTGEEALSVAVSSGLMALTGREDGPPVAPPAGLVTGLDRLVRTIEERAAALGSQVAVRWEPLVAGRAALLGLGRRGQVSANGTCRLVRASDGWVAFNLPRPDDLRLAGVLARCAGDDPWGALTRHTAVHAAATTVAQARELGLPAAVLAPPAGHSPWHQECWWAPGPPRPLHGLRVVDLSAMWAGPLAARLLADAGAEVVKVESATRPDGARSEPVFYRWLHPESQEVVVVDFASAGGRKRLRSLLASAEVVIEASRPRALEQLDAGPSSLPARRGRVWLSITGYGCRAPGRDWVAFGDDAAVAGGLVAWDVGGDPVFCGDAIADPVTGLTAAAAVLCALAAGGGVLLDVSLSGSASAVVDAACFGRPGRVARRSDDSTWLVDLERGPVPVLAPEPPPDEGAGGPGDAGGRPWRF